MSGRCGFRSLGWTTALALGLAAGASLRAEPSGAEQKAFRAARQSFDEGAFDVADHRLDFFLKTYPASEWRARAELLDAQALYQAGRSESALAALTLPTAKIPPDLQAETFFWRGAALLDLERWPEAEQAYRAVLATPKVEGGLSSLGPTQLGLAWALFRQGRKAEALPLAQEAARDPRGEAAPAAQLFLAKVDLAESKTEAALARLTALDEQNPPRSIAVEARYWLGEAYLSTRRYIEAQAVLQKITTDPQAAPKSRVAQAYLALARAERELGQSDQAAAAYDQAFRLTENATTQVAAFRAYLESARASGTLLEAVARLQDYARTSTQAAPAALFAIGSVLADAQADEKAVGILESLLVAYPKSTWVPAAQDRLGQLAARAGKLAPAIAAFQACIAASPDPELVRSARFQLGTTLYQNRDYPGAIAQFLRLSGGSDGLAESAAYNLVLAQAGLGKADAVDLAATDFQKRFPQSAHLKAIAQTRGNLARRTAHPDQARAAYEAGLALPGRGADHHALLKALIDLQVQTGDLAGALENCGKIVAQYPDDSLPAAQRGLLLSYELKKITAEQVEQALQALAQRYQKSPRGAESLFRLGEFYFFRQDYAKAQEAFQQLTAGFPEHPLAAEAYYFAARAAAAHQDRGAALDLFEKVPENSPLKSDALLARGVIYQQQLRYREAAATADLVLGREKTGERFVAANLLKGTCFFELGPGENSNYPVALGAFDQILSGQEGTPAERNEAGVRKAKCLEKMGRRLDAIALYLDVLYGRLGGDDPTVGVNDFSWQIKAGWEAGRIRETSQDWHGAIAIYQRMEQIGGAHQQDFHDLANRIRRENYIFE